MKINDFEDQIPDHSVYITTNDFSKYNTNDTVNEKIKRKLATKYDIADFIKKTVFDEKLQSINKAVSLNKTEHLEAKRKLPVKISIKIICANIKKCILF